MENDKLKSVLEALFAAADKPLSVNQLFDFFTGDLEQPGKDDIRKAIQELSEKYRDSGFELKQVASGFRFQVRAEFETWVVRLWEQKPPRYSRALMETLALIAYRQPITRGEIEDIRGVAVSSNIVKTLLERDWIKSLGHKEVPGHPTLYGTTKTFLDYFNLKSLNELPTLAEIRDLDQYNPEFKFDDETGAPAPQDAAVSTPLAAPADAAEPETAADASSAEPEELTEAPAEAEKSDQAESSEQAETSAEAEKPASGDAGKKTARRKKAAVKKARPKAKKTVKKTAKKVAKKAVKKTSRKAPRKAAKSDRPAPADAGANADESAAADQSESADASTAPGKAATD